MCWNDDDGEIKTEATYTFGGYGISVHSNGEWHLKINGDTKIIIPRDKTARYFELIQKAHQACGE